jgi:hypothetical protein
MRRLAVILTLAAALAVALSGSASAMVPGPPFVTAQPNPVHLGHTVTIRGRQWPVIEFCTRRVRLRLESAQNAVLIGFGHVRDNGRFVRHFTPMAGRIGTGRWRVVARLRCESGQDGSANYITRRAPLRILP